VDRHRHGALRYAGRVRSLLQVALLCVAVTCFTPALPPSISARPTLSEEFHLTFDKSVVDAEKRFAETLPVCNFYASSCLPYACVLPLPSSLPSPLPPRAQSTGDVDQSGTRHYFSGLAEILKSKANYPGGQATHIDSRLGCCAVGRGGGVRGRERRGRRRHGSSPVPTETVCLCCAVPAAMPLISTRLSWAPAEGYVDYIKSHKFSNWYQQDGYIRDMVGKLPALDLEWTLEPLGGVTENQTLMLQPGVEYTLTVCKRDLAKGSSTPLVYALFALFIGVFIDLALRWGCAQANMALRSNRRMNNLITSIFVKTDDITGWSAPIAGICSFGEFTRAPPSP